MITSSSVESLEIPTGIFTVHGDLRMPVAPAGLVVFAHGSGSSRVSPRNRHVAEVLVDEGLATLLVDLLTPDEEALDEYTGKYRFDIERLGHRVSAAVDWAALRPDLAGLPLGCFGASTGAAAALVAAADRPASIGAVVSRGGRPDLAGEALPRVQAPTLFIVGGQDREVLEMNRTAMQQMRAPAQLEIVPGATHLFQEPGALDTVARLAAGWFRRHLASPGASAAIVPIPQWAGFLREFGSRHRGWLVTVTTLAPGAAPQDLAALRPLDSIELIRDGGRITGVEVRFADAVSPQSIVALEPKFLRVDETPRGAERGLEVEDRYGLRTRIRFRATALPEEVDGLTPGEL